MRQQAMFGAGCFWSVEAAFRALEGVTDTAVGYSGGVVEQPTYRDVCSGRTGHAEVVWVEFDDQQVDYAQLLRVFFAQHDPTQVDRQGPDVGTQYRSVIFAHDDLQRREAERACRSVEASLGRPVATRVEEASTFWPAEEYHQRYLEKRGMASCRIQD